MVRSDAESARSAGSSPSLGGDDGGVEERLTADEHAASVEVEKV